MKGRAAIAIGVALVVGLGIPSILQGQGFGVYEQGACAMGRGGAAVADPCDDGSAIFFNPAALSFAPGLEISFGGTAIVPATEFAFDGPGGIVEGDDEADSLFHGYVRYGLGENLALGFGAYAPYGFATSWPSDFEGAFVGFDNTLRTLYLQPTVAWRVSDRLSIGGGPVLVVSDVELRGKIDLSRHPVPPGIVGGAQGVTFAALGIPPDTEIATRRLEADGATGFATHVGVAYEASDRIRIGARWLSSATVEYAGGDADFEIVSSGITLPLNNPFGVQGGTALDAVLQQAGLFAENGPLGDQTVSIEIEMPDQVVVGVRVDATERLTLMADWQWTSWSTFDRVEIDFRNPGTRDEVRVENYRDTNGLRVGGEYALDRGWTIRAGWVTNEEASPPEAVTPILFEAPRDQLAAGATVPLGRRVALDLGYVFLVQDDRSGRVDDPLPGRDPTVELNRGEFSLDSHLVGLDLRFRF